MLIAPFYIILCPLTLFLCHIFCVLSIYCIIMNKVKVTRFSFRSLSLSRLLQAHWVLSSSRRWIPCGQFLSVSDLTGRVITIMFLSSCGMGESTELIFCDLCLLSRISLLLNSQTSLLSSTVDVANSIIYDKSGCFGWSPPPSSHRCCHR